MEREQVNEMKTTNEPMSQQNLNEKKQLGNGQKRGTLPQQKKRTRRGSRQRKINGGRTSKPGS